MIYLVAFDMSCFQRDCSLHLNNIFDFNKKNAFKKTLKKKDRDEIKKEVARSNAVSFKDLDVTPKSRTRRLSRSLSRGRNVGESSKKSNKKSSKKQSKQKRRISCKQKNLEKLWANNQEEKP